MLRTFQFRILTALGAACIALVALNIFLFTGNSTRQLEVNARAQYIQQSAQLQNLYQQMVRGLADLSVRNKDQQLRDLLSRQGINVTVTPQPAAQTAPADSDAVSSAARKSRHP